MIKKFIKFISTNLAGPLFLVVDLFCGFGGTTTGYDNAVYAGPDGKIHKIAKVIACVNHDPKAIKSHWLNHPDVKHFEEDIRTLDLTELTELVNYWREVYPGAYVVLWASLECTNHSKAKGGLPRDADSRTLAEHLERYQKALNPDYIKIENVVEFMAWGPLDDNGKPMSRKNGQDWLKWRNSICQLGYYDEWKEMNSADYGAYTSRNRLFGCFAKHGLPIVWPNPTHNRVIQKGRKNYYLQQQMYKEGLKPWKAVKEVLDFTDEGESIFNRKKDLVPATLERVYAGLVKYVAQGDTSFISKYFSGRPAGKVKPEYFIDKHFGKNQNQSIHQPAGVIMCNDKHRLVEATPFLAPTNYDNGPKSIEEPCPTITANRKHHYIVNPSHGGHSTSTEAPCPVIIARQDKAPLYLVQGIEGKYHIPIYDTDCDAMVRIKQFMAIYGLVEIKMRMLRVPELLRIQGFPEDYKMVGNQSDHKKFIGNSVVPHVVKSWVEAFANRITSNRKIA